MKKNNSTEDLSFIKDKLDTIKESLTLARGILQESNKIESKSQHNVRFIAPQIKYEYSEFENNKEKTVIELLNKHEQWSFEISATIAANANSLRNKKLKEHLESMLLICESLDYVFRSMFTK